jgi:hypothetical protein
VKTKRNHGITRSAPAVRNPVCGWAHGCWWRRENETSGTGFTESDAVNRVEVACTTLWNRGGRCQICCVEVYCMHGRRGSRTRVCTARPMIDRMRRTNPGRREQSSTSTRPPRRPRLTWGVGGLLVSFVSSCRCGSGHVRFGTSHRLIKSNKGRLPLSTPRFHQRIHCRDVSCSPASVSGPLPGGCGA